MDASQVSQYLRNAIACFQDTLEIELQSADAMINLAVAKAKLARITKDPVEKERLFEASFRQYEVASKVVKKHSLHFDYANALYRFAKEKLISNETQQGVALLQRAMRNFVQSLELKKTLEAWINLGVTIEKLVLNLADPDWLVDGTTYYLSLRSLDFKRAETLRQRILKHAPPGRLVTLCLRDGSNLSGSTSPGEPHLKQSDDYLDMDGGGGGSTPAPPNRKGSILTSFKKFIRKEDSASSSAPATTLPQSSAEYNTIGAQNLTYIAPNKGGPNFQGDTLQ